MHNDDFDTAYDGRALVAAFDTRETARAAAARLHEEGFHDIWLGVTRPNDDAASDGESATVVEPANETFGDRIARFFGEGRRSLYDELVRHGVSDSEARRLDGGLPPHSTILTVDGANHPELAAELIEQSSGHLVAGEHFGSVATDTIPERGSQVLGYGSGREYARGERIDEERRLQLRSERLDVAKERVAAGEAQVGTEVTERVEERDVPAIREELFIERRTPATATAAGDAVGEIGSGEAIRIPLMRENVVVTKRPVVTGEYVVGKRAVNDTQHVRETLREERLSVNDAPVKDRATTPVEPA